MIGQIKSSICVAQVSVTVLLLVIVHSANLAPINSNVKATTASVPGISNQSNKYQEESLIAAANDNNGAAAGGPVAGQGANNKNTNVYAGANNGATQTADGKPNNRGYNQGYSYNSGIKPYTTGYTYYQPFGDAAKDQNNQSNQAGAAKPVAAAAPNHHQHQQGGAPPVQPPIPIELPNFFGGNQPQFGPVKMIPNQNVPLDENGIPNLDAIPLQNNNQANGNNGNMVQQVPLQPQNVQQMNPNEFAMPNDFNLNNILAGPQPKPRPRPQPMGDFGMGDMGLGVGGNQNQRQNNNNNGGGMFDFQPPSSNNFDFGTPNGGDSRDYNRMDNFAGNVNNFDTYLGDPGTNSGTGMDNLGLGGQQQVPSEIVNLNNAFGTDNNGNNNNDNMNDILGQFGGDENGGGGGGGGADPSNGNIDLGSFGSPSSNSNQNSMFPF